MRLRLLLCACAARMLGEGGCAPRRRGPSSPAPFPMGCACNNTLEDLLSLALSHALPFPTTTARACSHRHMMDNIVVVQTV